MARQTMNILRRMFLGHFILRFGDMAWMAITPAFLLWDYLNAIII
jgi:hypothetical protein